MYNSYLKKIVNEGQPKSLIKAMVIGGSIATVWSCQRHRMDVGGSYNLDHNEKKENIALSPIATAPSSTDRDSVVASPINDLLGSVEEIINSLKQLNNPTASIHHTSDRSFISKFEAIRRDLLWKKVSQIGALAVVSGIAAFSLSSYLAQLWLADPSLPEDSYLHPNRICTPPDQWHTTGDLTGSWVNATDREQQACDSYCFDVDIMEYNEAAVNGSYKNCTLSNNETIPVAYHLKNTDLLLEQCKKALTYLSANESTHLENRTDWLQSLSTCDAAVRQGLTLFRDSLLTKRSLLSAGCSTVVPLVVAGVARVVAAPFTKSGERAHLLSALQSQVTKIKDIDNKGDLSALPPLLSQLSLILQHFIDNKGWKHHNWNQQTQEIGRLREKWEQSEATLHQEIGTLRKRLEESGEDLPREADCSNQVEQKEHILAQVAEIRSHLKKL